MEFDLSLLRGLPSPFYRVSAKAFIFDENKRLLMGRAPDGVWEPPGGGWEHNETIQECLERELIEELGVKLKSFNRIVAIYRGENVRGFQALKIGFETVLESRNFQYGDLIEAKFVSQH